MTDKEKWIQFFRGFGMTFSIKDCGDSDPRRKSRLLLEDGSSWTWCNGRILRLLVEFDDKDKFIKLGFWK